MHRSARGNDPELNQLPDAVIRRADEIAALAEDFVLPRPPTLSRDIILLATARARQEMQNPIHNALSVHSVPGSRFGDIGLKGTCSFVHHLPYVCPNNVFVLPVAHLLLYGVIRDVNRFILGPPSAHKYALTTS